MIGYKMQRKKERLTTISPAKKGNSDVFMPSLGRELLKWRIKQTVMLHELYHMPAEYENNSEALLPCRGYQRNGIGYVAVGRRAT